MWSYLKIMMSYQLMKIMGDFEENVAVQVAEKGDMDALCL